MNMKQFQTAFKSTGSRNTTLVGRHQTVALRQICWPCSFFFAVPTSCLLTVLQEQQEWDDHVWLSQPLPAGQHTSQRPCTQQLLTPVSGHCAVSNQQQWDLLAAINPAGRSLTCMQRAADT